MELVSILPEYGKITRKEFTASNCRVIFLNANIQINNLVVNTLKIYN